MTRIPTYSADGSMRLRDHTLSEVLRAEREHRVKVTRRNGAIQCARYRPGARPATSRLIGKLPMGTRYVFVQQVGDHRAWSHKDLPVFPSEDFELDVRTEQHLLRQAVFYAVVLSIAKPESAPTEAKVVSIDAGRKRTQAQVVELTRKAA